MEAIEKPREADFALVRKWLDQGSYGGPLAAVLRWFLSQPPAPELPKPRAVWREGDDSDGNTSYFLEVDGRVVTTLLPTYRHNAVWWDSTSWADYLPDLASAKRRAEELAGVTTEDVRVSSGALDTGAEVLGIEGMSPIYLTKHHLRRLMPHLQAWLETDSLKLPEDGGAT